MPKPLDLMAPSKSRRLSHRTKVLAERGIILTTDNQERIKRLREAHEGQ